MMKCWSSVVRKVTPLLAAGTLLQAGGCGADLQNAGQTLLVSIANDLIASVIFGALNLSTGGF